MSTGSSEAVGRDTSESCGGTLQSGVMGLDVACRHCSATC